MTSTSSPIGFRVGVDLGGTKIAGIMFDGSERIVAETRCLSPQGDYDTTLDAIAAVVRELEAAAGAAASVGIGMPGCVAPATGRVQNANSTWLNNKPIKIDLEIASADLFDLRTMPTALYYRKLPTVRRLVPASCSASSSGLAAAAASQSMAASSTARARSAANGATHRCLGWRPTNLIAHSAGAAARVASRPGCLAPDFRAIISSKPAAHRRARRLLPWRRLAMSARRQRLTATRAGSPAGSL
jgi:hypothetical protein